MSALITYNSPLLMKAGITPENRANAVQAIRAASMAIERYCKRVFALTNHDEVHHAGQFGTVFLNNFPVTQITRVFNHHVLAFTPSNSVAVAANFNTTPESLLLTATANGATTTSTLDYATYPTLTALAAAVNGLGNGWAASIPTNPTNLGAYSSADLVANQWGEQGRGIAMWMEKKGRHFRYDAKGGIIQTQFHRSEPLRFQYQAGFAVIPEDIQQICANLTAYFMDPKNGGILIEMLGEYSYTLAATTIDRLPIQDKQVLDMYRDRKNLGFDGQIGDFPFPYYSPYFLPFYWEC
jgi:hypothetical protein